MNCEEIQITLSSWIDGEVELWDTLPAADHMLDCATCQAFYRRARDLEKALAAREITAAAERTSPGLWWVPRWVLPLAATLALAVVGFTLGRMQGVRSTPTASASVAMTDERFVGIAAELLQSGPRYQREMARVMDEIRSTRPLELRLEARPPASAEAEATTERAEPARGNGR